MWESSELKGAAVIYMYLNVFSIITSQNIMKELSLDDQITQVTINFVYRTEDL